MPEISGRLTTFAGKPLAGGDVRIMDAKFSTVAECVTAQDGSFGMQVPPGRYRALFACEGYSERHLEYWFWDIPTLKDRVLQIRIGSLEIYGMRGFRVPGGGESLFIYFRPMSLQKAKAMEQLKKKENSGAWAPVHIAPVLTPDSLVVRNGNEAVTILSFQKIEERAPQGAHGGLVFQGYLVQIPFPLSASAAEITIEARDSETGEQGMGTLCWEDTLPPTGARD